MAKVYSQVGDQSLEINAKQNNYTNWMYAQIKPFLKGDVLEIGSGIGTYSKKVIKQFPKSHITLSDIEPDYVKKLEEKYKDNKNVNTLLLDLGNSDHFKKLNKKYDSVFALNVLEHVQDDVKALDELYDILNPGGTCIILVPAHMILYNGLDRAIDHYRRYAKKMMKVKVSFTKFKLKKMFYYNFFSCFGWYLYGTILKKKNIGEGSMGFFNYLVPFLSFIEKYILFKKLGYSLITVLEKPKK